MLGKGLDKGSNFIFLELILDEFEESFVELEAVLVLDFYEGHRFEIVGFEVADDRFFCVEQLAGDGRRKDALRDRLFLLARSPLLYTYS